VTEQAKRTTAQVWKALEEIAADVKDLARIAELDDEALDRELKLAGIDPADAARVGKALHPDGGDGKPK